MYILLGKGGKVTKTVCPLPIGTRAAIFKRRFRGSLYGGKTVFLFIIILFIGEVIFVL
ncbi:hypothetical protein HMPREF1039_1116 [Megasphaera lornae]|uniref:Uncharacterized protein n=1 Tax=Megasphaera lornae TaxID=1000568 RepID=A0ABP2L526_9FIRM|nr:hypothetical protein HMPREF1039_1116 [Megasphaera lornae]